jgi:hypothetical protein
MAWQLIYTSAPRLLDAGRTGFGTVARHRAVSGLLASTIERFSQFARLPGFDTKRVVYSHRLLTVGSGEFHVLSCIRDAGSDYTGRTNHLAHHLIAEAREIRNLGLAGITPADILLGMPWLETWTSSPRFLESADEINLSTFRNPESNEWQRLTGNLHHALLPWSPSAKKGLYFVLPPGLDARTLILESLQEHPGDSWKIPFTTCLEPNDDVADFKWIAVPATSPLCPQPGTAARLILDLTRPAQLPAPPSLPTETHYSEAASAPSPATLNTPAPTAPSPDLPPPSSNPQFPSTAPVPAWSPTPAKSTKGLGLSTRLLIGSAAAIVMIGGALLISNFINQRVENRRVAAIHQQIAELWTRQKPNLPETEQYLRKEALTDHSLSDSLAQLNERLQKIRASLEAGKPQDSISAISKKTLPRDFQSLLDAYELWQKSHHAASQKREWLQLSPGDLTASLKSQLEETTRARTTVASRFSGELPVGTANWRKEIFDDLAQTLSESKERPKGTAKEWMELLAFIHPDSPMPEWITGWMASEAPMTPEQIKRLETHQRKLASNDTAPNWVTQVINSKLAKSSQAKVEHGPTKAQDTKDSNKEPVSFSFYDELKDTWPIFVAQQSEQVSLIETLHQLPPIELTQEMMAHVSPSLPALQAAMTKKAAFLDPTRSHTVEPNGTLIWRKSKMDTSSTLAFKASRITKLPDSFAGGKILFTNAKDSKPQLAIHITTPQTNDYAVHVLNFKDTPTFTTQQSGTVVRIQGLASMLNRLNNISEPLILRGNTPQLAAIRLNFRSNPNDAIIQFQIPTADPRVIGAKNKELEDLKIAIDKDTAAIKEIESSKESNRADRVKVRTQDLQQKQNRAAQLEEDLKGIQSPTLPEILLPPNQYIIATEKAPNMLICIIQTQAASPPSPSK